MQSEHELQRAMNEYANTVRRLCVVYLKNDVETEDVFQDVFLKFMLHSGSFESPEHEKAWIIRVTINACKDVLKSFFRNNTVTMDVLADVEAESEDANKEVLEAVLSLPKKYKEVVYLHYYEGYTALEIGRILNRNVNTVYTFLNRAKKMLKEKLGGDLE